VLAAGAATRTACSEDVIVRLENVVVAGAGLITLLMGAFAVAW